MNIMYLQEQLSQIEEIHVIGKNAEVNGVICHVMGIVRYGKQMKLLVLQYDEVFQEKMQDAEGRDIDLPMTNRMMMRGDRTIDTTHLLSGVHKVFIGEQEYEVHESESRRIDGSDYQSILLLTEFLRQGWQPKGIDYQDMEMLFLNSISLDGVFTTIPAFGENPTLRFMYGPVTVTGRVEQPINLVVGGHYPDKLLFRNVDTNEEHWAQINQVYLADIWTQMEKVFADPKMQEHATLEELSQAKSEFEELLIQICPRGMYFPVIEYECEEEISLEFYTRSYLDAVPESSSNCLAIMIGPNQSTGILGSTLKAAIIQDPYPENTNNIEAELFSYLFTTTSNDLVIK